MPSADVRRRPGPGARVSAETSQNRGMQGPLTSWPLSFRPKQGCLQAQVASWRKVWGHVSTPSSDPQLPPSPPQQGLCCLFFREQSPSGGCGVTCCSLAEGRTRAQGGSARWDGAWSSSGLEVGLGQQGQAPPQRADATPQGHTWECRGLGAAPWWGEGYRPVVCGLQR